MDIVIKLKHPIVFGSARIEEFSIRAMKAGDLRTLQSLGDNQTILTLGLISLLSGHPDGVVDELQGEDLKAVLKAVDGFI